VTPAKRQGEVRDCPSVPMALARDFLWASIALELRAALARPNARERRLKRQPRDARQMAVCQLAYQVAPLEAPMVSPQAP